MAVRAKVLKIDRSHYLFSNRKLFTLIVPLIVEQFLAVLVGMADSIMVATVGEAAVSGVSLVDSVMLLLINIFAALATGGAVVSGQYLGRKNQRKACRAAEGSAPSFPWLLWAFYTWEEGLSSTGYSAKSTRTLWDMPTSIFSLYRRLFLLSPYTTQARLSSGPWAIPRSP